MQDVLLLLHRSLRNYKI